MYHQRPYIKSFPYTFLIILSTSIIQEGNWSEINYCKTEGNPSKLRAGMSTPTETLHVARQ